MSASPRLKQWAKQWGWFILIWALSIAALTVVAWIIRLFLKA